MSSVEQEEIASENCANSLSERKKVNKKRKCIDKKSNNVNRSAVIILIILIHCRKIHDDLRDSE